MKDVQHCPATRTGRITLSACRITLLSTKTLWKLLLSRRLDIGELSGAAVERSSVLMAMYADRPMDLADATLVALAEERNQRRIFTLDDGFRIYRIHGRTRFEIVPG